MRCPVCGLESYDPQSGKCAGCSDRAPCSKCGCWVALSEFVYTDVGVPTMADVPFSCSARTKVGVCTSCYRRSPEEVALALLERVPAFLDTSCAGAGPEHCGECGGCDQSMWLAEYAAFKLGRS